VVRSSAAGHVFIRCSSASGELRIALFLTELAPTWLRRPLARDQLLAAIPASLRMWGCCVRPVLRTMCSRS